MLLDTGQGPDLDPEHEGSPIALGGAMDPMETPMTSESATGNSGPVNGSERPNRKRLLLGRVTYTEEAEFASWLIDLGTENWNL